MALRFWWNWRATQREEVLYAPCWTATRDEKIGLARVLARSGDTNDVPGLQKLSQDTDPDVAQEGLRALRQNVQSRQKRKEAYLAFFCFCWPTRTLKCRSWLPGTPCDRGAPRHPPGTGRRLVSLGRTDIRVKLSAQVGQKGRNRFTFGIAITLLSLADKTGKPVPGAAT